MRFIDNAAALCAAISAATAERLAESARKVEIKEMNRLRKEAERQKEWEESWLGRQMAGIRAMVTVIFWQLVMLAAGIGALYPLLTGQVVTLAAYVFLALFALAFINAGE